VAAIPQMDPSAFYRAHKGEVDSAIGRVLESGRYILAHEVAAFEAEFAGALGIGHAIGVANGTEALELALRALGIGPGDRVATVSHTAVATVAAIELAGAEPVLVDIDPATFTLAPGELSATFDAVPNIKAVIAVHLYGQPADLPKIRSIAQSHGAWLVEDCAQSHGARLDGRWTGTFGDIAAFSFYPTKNLGGYGDGGLVATADPLVAERVKSLREYGWTTRRVSEAAGMNSRLDELQAAILRIRLKYLLQGNARRREIASAYDRGLADSGLVLPIARPNAQHAYHQYVVRHARRDELRTKLTALGIGTNVHYPVPVHLQPAYSGRLAIVRRLGETEAAAREVLSLPMFPELDETAVLRVIAAVRQALEGRDQ
jgi:dTDP-4-amino-4,6-dideoxygalactose transaminase